MLPIIFALACSVSTYIGGLIALKWKDKTHLLSAWASGAILSVGVFDLLPASIELAGNMQNSLMYFMVGLFGYHAVNNLIPLIFHSEECNNEKHKSNLSILSLFIHSILDGIMIGLTFKISPSIGFATAVGILIHDSNDGLSVVVKAHDKKSALKWLVCDAFAPILGVLLTFVFSVSDKNLGNILGIFSAFFVYIALSSLNTESHHNHPKLWNILMTIFGSVFMFIVIKATH